MKVKHMKSILAANKFDNYECNFKVKTGKPRITLEDIMNEIKIIKTNVSDLKNDIKNINTRIDNLVKVNNLKE